MADDRAQARREAATLLGVDIDHMSPADALRIDMISALRLVIDAEQASVLDGNQADLGKLNVAVQSLIALLPGRELPAPEQHDDHEAREAMIAPLRRLYRHLHEENARLTAENAQLRAVLAGKPLPHHVATFDPAEADIVPPSERAECDPGVKPGPDDWRARRSPVTIEGKAVKPAPAAPAPRATPTAKPAWQDWLDAGGYGGPGFDRWSNRNF